MLGFNSTYRNTHKGQKPFWLKNGLLQLSGGRKMQDLCPQPFLVNTLLDDGFIAHQCSQLAQASVPDGLWALQPLWREERSQASLQ